MKFNFTVDTNDCYDGYDFEEEIIRSAADAFIQQIIGDTYDKNSKSYQLERMINNKVNEIMNKDFKDELANIVVEKLADRFEKSKQYKELVKGNEIETDNVMKCGLKDIVKDIVKSEMKNMFK